MTSVRSYVRFNRRTGKKVKVRAHKRQTNRGTGTESRFDTLKAQSGADRQPFRLVRNNQADVTSAVLDAIRRRRPWEERLVTVWDDTVVPRVPVTYLTTMYVNQRAPRPSVDAQSKGPADRKLGRVDLPPAAEIEPETKRQIEQSFVGLGVGRADEGFDAAVRSVAAELNSDPTFTHLAQRYGAVPMATGQAPDGEYRSLAGGYMPYGLLVMIDDTKLNGTKLPSHGPLTTQGTTSGVDESLRGVIAHEYGHHVHPRVPVDTIHEFGEAWERNADRRAIWDVANQLPFTDPGPFPSVSHRAMTSPQEGFAECVSAVTHPEYNRDLFDTNSHEMLEIAETVVFN